MPMVNPCPRLGQNLTDAGRFRGPQALRRGFNRQAQSSWPRLYDIHHSIVNMMDIIYHCNSERRDRRSIFREDSMARYPKEQKAQTREQILTAASQAFR